MKHRRSGWGKLVGRLGFAGFAGLGVGFRGFGVGYVGYCLGIIVRALSRYIVTSLNVGGGSTEWTRFFQIKLSQIW